MIEEQKLPSKKQIKENHAKNEENIKRTKRISKIKDKNPLTRKLAQKAFVKKDAAPQNNIKKPANSKKSAAVIAPIPADTKSSFISIVGATNSGKSTLVNYILDKKVSITSHKVQTTRFNIKGIKQVDDANTQLVFIDTPGDFNPRRRLDKAMISAIWNAVSDSDTVIFLLDCIKAKRVGYQDAFVEHLKKIAHDRRVLLVLNKIDLIHKQELLEIITRYNAYECFSKTFLISSTTGHGVADLVKDLVENAPASPWYYEVDRKTDLNDKLFTAEITRESVYKYLHQELPYEINVTTDTIEDQGNKIEVWQTIYATRQSQKLIIIGNKGIMLKRIGTEAREQLRQHFKKRVTLKIFVKIKENWQETKEFYDDMGLEF